MTESALQRRVSRALNEDNSIAVPLSELHTTQGFSTAYMESLGLKKTDLKRLASFGLARLGYTKNIWTEGEILPNSSKVVKQGESYRGKGHSPRWILLLPEETVRALPAASSAHSE